MVIVRMVPSYTIEHARGKQCLACLVLFFSYAESPPLSLEELPLGNDICITDIH